MTRSIVKLPRDVGDDFEGYVNGVLQQPDVDYYVDRNALIFDRPLRGELEGVHGLGGCLDSAPATRRSCAPACSPSSSSNNRSTSRSPTLRG